MAGGRGGGAGNEDGGALHRNAGDCFGGKVGGGGYPNAFIADFFVGCDTTQQAAHRHVGVLVNLNARRSGAPCRR
ncbi:MAG: hypothetical protein PHE09_11485 [Oscillospiraceae bacterium]|nr:hypothetical protein [Oscillospiraceae bacterium]